MSQPSDQSRLGTSREDAPVPRVEVPSIQIHPESSDSAATAVVPNVPPASTTTTPGSGHFEIPARNLIPIIPNIANGILGQQITYILILRASFIDKEVDLVKVFNAMWNGPGLVIDSEGNETKGTRLYPYPKIGDNEFENMWEQQSMYPRDPKGMKAALGLLKKRTDFSIPYMRLHPLNLRFLLGNFGEVMAWIKERAKMVEVELTSEVFGRRWYD